MPITVSTRCETCKGQGYTYWMHNDVPWTQPCKECGGAGRVPVSVRTFDDSLDDVWRDYGIGNVVAPTHAEPHPDAAPAKPHACLDCLAFGDAYDDSDEIIHTPCERHSRRQPDPAPERGSDSDNDLSRSGRAAAAAVCGHTDAGSPCFRLDGSGEGVPPGVRGPVHSVAGSAIDTWLEEWK